MTTREHVIGEGITWLSRWAWRWLIIAAGAVVLGFVIQQLWVILLPLALALILSSVLQSPSLLLERRLDFAPALAAGVTIVVALLVVATLGLLIAPPVGSQLGEIAANASDGLTTLSNWARDSRFNITGAQIDSLTSAVQDRLKSSASQIAGGVLTTVSAVTSVLINVLLTLVLSFFVLKDGRHFLPWLSRLTGPQVGGHLTELGSRSWSTLGGFVRTQALVGLLDAIFIGLGLVIVGVPLAFPLAVLTFIGAFAPIVGAVTVGALAVLVALVSNGWVAALIILAVVLVVQQLEGNLFLPWLQGRSLNLHAGVVLLAVVLGSSLFGIAGAFLSVPVVAVLAMAGRYLSELVDDHSDAPPADEPPAEDPSDDDGSTEESAEVGEGEREHQA